MQCWKLNMDKINTYEAVFLNPKNNVLKTYGYRRH